ncbi:HRAD17 [Mytilus coruscus]|uniref:HRAD17 n=1 Tax=Mytilus coruscus TaxID=42192 RepID=A0A6J8CG22_MYTCO|nr:HRAD17 [Mytilus coruscus]
MDDSVIDLTDSPPPSLDRKRKRSEVNSVNKKTSQWVTSAFGDFIGVKTQKSTNKNSSKSTWSRKKSSNDLSSSQTSNQGSLPVDKYFSSSNVPTKKFTTTKKNRPAFETELWSDKYAPKSQSDLAVHKKKISEVECWIQKHLSAQGKLPPILLLTGPAGVGKTATIQSLSKDLRFTIQEWINPLTNTTDKSFTDPFSDDKPYRYLSSESQMSLFQQFLLRANKYNSLGIFGEDVSSRKVILVEEFPNVFYRDASTFHDIVRKYRKIGKCPLVFIVSDSTRGDSNERLLFPKDLQHDLDIENIR